MAFSTKCYIIPVIAGVTYLTLNSIPVERELAREIPDPIYRHVTKALILVVIVFIVCRIIDLQSGTCEDTDPATAGTTTPLFQCQWCQNDNYLPKDFTG